MTIQEALDKRIPRICKLIWGHKDTYLRLPLLPDGKFGPWAELYGDTEQTAIDIPVGSQRMCVLLPDVVNEKGYDRYRGKVSEHEASDKNFARLYVEK
jgi:hypothetical protein